MTTEEAIKYAKDILTAKESVNVLVPYDILKTLVEAVTDPWIPVKSGRLPDKGVKVLTYSRELDTGRQGGPFRVLETHEGQSIYQYDAKGVIPPKDKTRKFFSEVTHWMPIKAPKKGE